MTEMEVPILMRPAVLTGANRKSPGMLALYPDGWCTSGPGSLIGAQARGS